MTFSLFELSIYIILWSAFGQILCAFFFLYSLYQGGAEIKIQTKKNTKWYYLDPNHSKLEGAQKAFEKAELISDGAEMGIESGIAYSEAIYSKLDPHDQKFFLEPMTSKEFRAKFPKISLNE